MDHYSYRTPEILLAILYSIHKVRQNMWDTVLAEAIFKIIKRRQNRYLPPYVSIC